MQPTNSSLPSSSPSRLRADRWARHVVILGGLATILCILGIMLFLLEEALPLALPADVEPQQKQAGVEPLMTLAGDPYQDWAVGIDAAGRLRAVDLTGDGRGFERPVEGLQAGERVTGGRGLPGGLLFRTDRNRVGYQALGFTTSYAGQERSILPEPGLCEWVEPPSEGARLRACHATPWTEDGFTIATQFEDQPLLLHRVRIEVNDFTQEKSLARETESLLFDTPLRLLRIDRGADNLFGVDEEGRLYWWRIQTAEGGERPQVLETGLGEVTAMSFLLGDRSLVLGSRSGKLAQFFTIRPGNAALKLAKIRSFAQLGGGIVELVPARRNKSFVAADSEGRLGLYYATSGNLGWSGDADVGAITSVVLCPKGDGLLASGTGGLALLAVDDPHPEATFGTYFTKVWYEGYPEPDYTWQSTGGSDDFEIKLSLIPLVFGTIKGTLFSMCLSIPLALFGALYASMFLHHGVKRLIKPIIEIMAAIPSVILGFICAIYLAPLLEDHFGGFMLLPLTVPLVLVLASLFLERIPKERMERLPRITEIAVLSGALLLGFWLTFLLGTPLEGLLFNGDAPRWITDTLGLPYEQRNAIVIAMGMSFAVIPIIFSISEDALSNVPRSLISGSLALGASRWETAVHVVLPSASPGIFSAIMVGLGRAIGETMIVLMATGNTPILEWNPFNGFETLSACIATEIPEAPHHGTLYRTLFLAALMLFAMTFVLNTVAEIVRSNLRRRYANF